MTPHLTVLALIILALIALAVIVIVNAKGRKPTSTGQPLDNDTAWSDPITPADEAVDPAKPAPDHTDPRP